MLLVCVWLDGLIVWIWLGLIVADFGFDVGCCIGVWLCLDFGCRFVRLVFGFMLFEHVYVWLGVIVSVYFCLSGYVITDITV